MAYTDFGPPRRSRRRRNIVILIVLLIVVGIVALAVRYRTERRESIDYLSQAQEIATQHAGMAERIGTLLQGLAGEDRPTLLQRIETMTLEAGEARRTLARTPVTRPVAEASGLITVAVESWEEGIDALDDAIVSILDAEPEDRTGDEQLRSAFELFRLGDRAYDKALESISMLDPEIVPATFPTVSYTGQEYAALYDATVIADRLRRLGTLSEERDIAVSATTIPEPVSEGAGGVWSIPASETLALEVTVSNTGNVIAERISVVVTLQRVSSSEDVPARSQLVPSIEPGVSVPVLFEDLDAEPGAVYTITAMASFEDGVTDANDDNTWTLVFERNAE